MTDDRPFPNVPPSTLPEQMRRDWQENLEKAERPIETLGDLLDNRQKYLEEKKSEAEALENHFKHLAKQWGAKAAQLDIDLEQFKASRVVFEGVVEGAHLNHDNFDINITNPEKDDK